MPPTPSARCSSATVGCDGGLEPRTAAPGPGGRRRGTQRAAGSAAPGPRRRRRSASSATTSIPAVPGTGRRRRRTGRRPAGHHPCVDGRRGRRPLPDWLTADDLEFYASEFGRTGFHRRAELVPQHGPQLGEHRQSAGPDRRGSGVVHRRTGGPGARVHPNRPGPQVVTGYYREVARRRRPLDPGTTPPR